MTPRLVQLETLAVDLFGYGLVGKALLPRLESAGIALASIHDSKGPRASLPVPASRRVLVDVTTPRYSGPDAEAWIARLEQALASGTSVVTANKAPLALAWPRLVRAADRGGAVLAHSATVGGGTPVIAFLRRLHASHGLVRVEAGLSGTLSFVLDRVARGESLEAATRAAQRAGFAEPDPTLDLDGTDAFAKAIILHNRVFPAAGTLSLADRTQRLVLDEKEIRAIAERGLVPQVVASITPGHATLDLVARDPTTTFLAPAGNAVVTATTQRGETFHLTGPGAGPAVTAGAILGDLQTLRERPRESGWGLVP